MPDVNIETPDWLRQMESILEELSQGVVIVDGGLRVVFANEALIRMGQYEFGEIFNSHRDMLGIEGLKTLAGESAQRAFPEMRQAILDGVAAESHGPLADDVSLVIVEVRQRSREPGKNRHDCGQVQGDGSSRKTNENQGECHGKGDFDEHRAA